MASFWIVLRYIAACVGGLSLWVSLMAWTFMLYTLVTEGFFGLTSDALIPWDFYPMHAAAWFVVAGAGLGPAIYAAVRMEGPEKRHGRMAVRVGVFGPPVLLSSYFFLAWLLLEAMRHR